MQNAVDNDAYELVNLADWEHLMTFYGAESSLPSAHPANQYALSACIPRCQFCHHHVLSCTALQAVLSRPAILVGIPLHAHAYRCRSGLP